MIIGKDSALRRLPDKSDPRRAMFLDGIRYSVEMADLAYGRLQSGLQALSTENDTDGSQEHASLFVEPFLDAWSIVDSIHRLRELLEHMPGSKKAKSPSYQLFARKTLPVRQFRNAIQHLRKELRQVSSPTWPVWGVLDWVTVIDAKKGLLRCCVMTAGRNITGEYPVCNPLGKKIRGLVDHITLQYKEDRLPISDTVRAVASVITPLQESLATEFQGMSSTGSDLLMRVTTQVTLEQSNP